MSRRGALASALLPVLLVALTAAGCGSSSKGHKSAQKTPTTESTAPTTTTPAKRTQSFTGGSLRASLQAGSHTPHAGTTPWPYTVRATTSGGRPVSGFVTVQIIDPSGGRHLATYRNTGRDLVHFPFRGAFSDFLRWPKAAAGYHFTFRVVVSTKIGIRELRYPVFVLR